MRFEATCYDHTCPGCQGCGAMACAVCAGIGYANDSGPRPPAEDVASRLPGRVELVHLRRRTPLEPAPADDVDLAVDRGNARAIGGLDRRR